MAVIIICMTSFNKTNLTKKNKETIIFLPEIFFNRYHEKINYNLRLGIINYDNNLKLLRALNNKTSDLN